MLACNYSCCLSSDLVLTVFLFFILFALVAFTRSGLCKLVFVVSFSFSNLALALLCSSSVISLCSISVFLSQTRPSQTSHFFARAARSPSLSLPLLSFFLSVSGCSLAIDLTSPFYAASKSQSAPPRSRSAPPVPLLICLLASFVSCLLTLLLLTLSIRLVSPFLFTLSSFLWFAPRSAHTEEHILLQSAPRYTAPYLLWR